MTQRWNSRDTTGPVFARRGSHGAQPSATSGSSCGAQPAAGGLEQDPFSHARSKPAESAAGLVASVGNLLVSAMLPSMEESTFEKHFSVRELAEQWGLGRESIRKRFQFEDGVVKLKLGRKKSDTRYSIPASVARRVHTKLAAQDTRNGRLRGADR
jgi:hypothetical protein